jgi:ribose 5-phosphate isomerase B
VKIALGCDHAGFGLKTEVGAWLKELGHDVVDVGVHSRERADYPTPAHDVAARVARGEVERGVLVCGSGIGVCIAANRHAGVRAANCTHELQGALCREHNDANVLCLGERLVGSALARAILEAFLRTEFAGGRHGDRVRAIEC